MTGLRMHRLGTLMEPEPGNPQEVEGVLNPAAVRGPDGQLYLFPRLVARGNFSRIGIARVRFSADGDPVGVERLGIALEPEADYELRPGGGGCEDPRVTFVQPLGCYVMTYTAFSLRGPRIALAISKDLFRWQRLGLVRFAAHHGVEFDDVDNKDACLFPVALPNRAGKMQIGLLHRPYFLATRPEEPVRHTSSTQVDLDRVSIWISYCPVPPEDAEPRQFGVFDSHLRLASPEARWERLKIGAGTPPVLTRLGWLIIYHGVADKMQSDDDGHRFRYSAGLMVLSAKDPHVIRYRSAEPVLSPEHSHERIGTVGDVVFPTGIDRRDDLGLPDRFDVYYGMADYRIGVARLDLPSYLPRHDLAEPSEALVE